MTLCFIFAGMAQKFVDDKVAQNKVMVFSKSYCPFCKMAKEALGETGVKYGLVELDERGTVCLIHCSHLLTLFTLVVNYTDDCAAIQDYLLQLTGARSVPRVFIGGKCIGGGSETRALLDQGKLIPMLKECGAL